jgi:hypothetical protein
VLAGTLSEEFQALRKAKNPTESLRFRRKYQSHTVDSPKLFTIDVNATFSLPRRGFGSHVILA